MKRAVFLDRDGVINEMVYHPEFGTVDSPANPDEFVMLTGVSDAVKRINKMGFLTVVISNQPGVAKGKMTASLLQATMAKMESQLTAEDAALDAIYYCMHHPQAKLEAYRVKCQCRKPRPGLLLRAASELNIDLQTSYFIGDGITDVVAGGSVDCRTILVNSRKCYLCDELSRQNVRPDYIAKDLSDAVLAIATIESGDLSEMEAFHYKCRLDSDCE